MVPPDGIDGVVTVVHVDGWRAVFEAMRGPKGWRISDAAAELPGPAQNAARRALRQLPTIL